MAELTDAQKVLRNDTGKRIAAAIEALGGTPPINLGMTGATPGQVPIINTVDENGAPTSYRPGAGGGSGGTSDYNDLSNKPSINNVALSGNKTAADLGLGTYSKPSGGIPASDLASAVQNKLDETVVVSDTQPTATENKLWVDTDAGTGTSYQIPTVAEMEAADNAALGNLAAIETSPTTASHVIGEYIVYNGQLYTVTASIAAGATLTVGTNIQAISASQIAQRIFHLAGGASVSLHHTMPVLIYTDRGGLWATGQASSRGLATLVAYSGFTITLVDNSNLTITSGIPGGATIAVISSGYFYFS